MDSTRDRDLAACDPQSGRVEARQCAQIAGLKVQTCQCSGCLQRTHSTRGGPIEMRVSDINPLARPFGTTERQVTSRHQSIRSRTEPMLDRETLSKNRKTFLFVELNTRPLFSHHTCLVLPALTWLIAALLRKGFYSLWPLSLGKSVCHMTNT
jgi:hypothetical protein